MDEKATRLLVVAVLGNLVLLTAMCSASLGSLEEAWILDQADHCVDHWRSHDEGDPRARFSPIVVDERWHSLTEAEFLLEMPVTDPGGETATVEQHWLACEAHEEKEGDDSVTVVDSVELRS